MTSLAMLNPSAASVKGKSARSVITNAARGLADTLNTNLGPNGTIKMLVSGAGELKLTKDGSVLLHEMQFQHPVAQMIARAVTAQDDTAGDGTTSTVLLIGELLRLAEYRIQCGLPPRSIVDGYAVAKEETIKFLDTFKISLADVPSVNREPFVRTAFTALNSKIALDAARSLSEICVDAVDCIYDNERSEIDLHMIEIVEMKHKLVNETRFVRGIVLDHGCRHPDMPKRLENCFILTCNVSMEYEKSEIAAEFHYDSANMKEKMMRAERKVVDDQTRKVIALKREVCANGEGFVVINQKGIDPIALDMLAKEGIMALRRAKKRNMERLVLACGGVAVNSFDGITPSDLGRAQLVTEHVLGEEKYTFVECGKDTKPKSCTILLKGSNKHHLAQMKDAVHDGLRAVKNTIDDKAVVPGAGAFEIAASAHLDSLVNSMDGNVVVGVKAFAEALTIIPRTLCNSMGRNADIMLIELRKANATKKSADERPALDFDGGHIGDASVLQLYDSYRAKRQIIDTAAELASKFLLCDEIMKAGSTRGRKDPLQE